MSLLSLRRSTRPPRVKSYYDLQSQVPKTRRASLGSIISNGRFGSGFVGRKKSVSGNIVATDTAGTQPKLDRVARPNKQEERRKEISLNLWILEAKNIPPKRRYFCEVLLDGELFAQTTIKMMSDMLFWGEEFNLCNLNEVGVLSLILYKCSEEGRAKKKRSHRKEICRIHIDLRDIDQRRTLEKWCSPSNQCHSLFPDSPCSHINQGIMCSTNTACAAASKSVPLTNFIYPATSAASTAAVTSASSDQTPMIRIKARYQMVDVLPLRAYEQLLNFLNDNAVKTLADMEPYLKLHIKEDLIRNIIKIIYKNGVSVPMLCDLIINEISKSDDKNLILRGNTMASKAMEIYLKLVGDKYLQLTLADFIRSVLDENDDCEVDPLKEPQENHLSSTPGATEKNVPHISLEQRQESLMMNVEMIWAKIMSSLVYFPRGLKAVFVTLRQRLRESKSFQMYAREGEETDLCDRIVSSCVFLRYICPALMTPSLFGLISDYPDNPKVIRTFTLVAKCIQTLANFSNLCGTKESYMVFMNTFIENNFKTMKDFLRNISCPTESGSDNRESGLGFYTPQSSHNDNLYLASLDDNSVDDTIDLGLCLANLHLQMDDCLQIISNQQKISETLSGLSRILADLNIKLNSNYGLMEAPTVQSDDHQINIAVPLNSGHIKRGSGHMESVRNSNDTGNQNTYFGRTDKADSSKHSNSVLKSKKLDPAKLHGSEDQVYLAEKSKFGSRRNSSNQATETEVFISRPRTNSSASDGPWKSIGTKRFPGGTSEEVVDFVPETIVYDSRRNSSGATDLRRLGVNAKLGSRRNSDEAPRQIQLSKLSIYQSRRSSADEQKSVKPVPRRYSDDSCQRTQTFGVTRWPPKQSHHINTIASHLTPSIEPTINRTVPHQKNPRIPISEEHGRQTLTQMKKSRSTNQVEMEWKDVLSASYGYTSEHRNICVGVKEPISQSSENIGPIHRSSPSSSWKLSVKWCKQGGRLTEAISQCHDHNASAHSEGKIKTVVASSKSLSSEDISKSRGKQSYEVERVESESSDTLTVDEPLPHDNITTGKSKSTPDPELVPQCLGDNNALAAHSGTISGYTPEKSAFRPPNTSRPRNPVPRHGIVNTMAMDDHLTGNEIRHEEVMSHGQRIKRVFVDDRRTLELELERVKYMKEICSGTFLGSYVYVGNLGSVTTLGMEAHNGSTWNPGEYPSMKTMSLQRYFDVAENVLTEACDRCEDVEWMEDNVVAKEWENHVIDIFQINRVVQTKLISESEHRDYLRESSSRASGGRDRGGSHVSLTLDHDPITTNHSSPTVFEFVDTL